MNRPSLRQFLWYFFILGATGFGGPVALVNYLRRDLVERERWITEEEYEQGLAIATLCPGPVAYQLGVYCGYVRYGVGGGLAVGLAFALAPFLLVVGVATRYGAVADAAWVRGIFYGVGPVVASLVARACWNLGRKTLKRDTAAWALAVPALVMMIAAPDRLIWAFLGGGILGIFFLVPKRRAPSPAPDAGSGPGPSLPPDATARAISWPVMLAAVPMTKSLLIWKLFIFFFKTSLLVFGSGLVIISFIKAFVVDQYHWLGNRAFVDAVAVGLITPGPAVIIATFVGYLVAGYTGALAATLGIFLPPILFTLAGTPLLLRYGRHSRVAGFARGVTVAVVGALTGTAYLIARPVIGDGATALIAALALVLPSMVKRLPDPALVAGGALLGVILYPILRPAWVP